MKKLLTTLLVFISFTAMTHASSLSAENCTFSQVEGKKLFKSYGRTMKECFNKNFLPESYETSTYNKCVSSHAPTSYNFYSNAYISKVCIKKDSLDEIYLVNKSEKCSDNYSTDNVVTYDGLQDLKVCVRNL